MNTLLCILISYCFGKTDAACRSETQRFAFSDWALKAQSIYRLSEFSNFPIGDARQLHVRIVSAVCYAAFKSFEKDTFRHY